MEFLIKKKSDSSWFDIKSHWYRKIGRIVRKKVSGKQLSWILLLGFNSFYKVVRVEKNQRENGDTKE